VTNKNTVFSGGSSMSFNRLEGFFKRTALWKFV